jgi:hypothetical protein
MIDMHEVIGMEAKVAASLRADAEQLVSSAGLHEGALARAWAIRRRRQVWRTGAGTGLATVLAAGVLVAPRLLLGAGSATSLGPSPSTPAASAPASLPASAPGPTTLPELPGAPTAASQPGIVGTDPGVLHFDVNLAALAGTASQWTPHQGFEAVALTTGSGDPHTYISSPLVEIFVGPDPAKLEAGRTPPGDYVESNDGLRDLMYEEGQQQPTTVNGQPGTIQRVETMGYVVKSVHVKPSQPDAPESSATNVYFSRLRGYLTWVLRWQPREGLYAIVEARTADPALAYRAAAALRLDHAQRCTVPAHLTDVPAGTKLTGCQTLVRTAPVAGHGVWVTSSVTLQLPDRTSAVVWLDEASRTRAPIDVAQFQSNCTVAGHPAQWRSTETPIGLWVLNFGAAEVFVSGVGKDMALRLAGGLRIAADLSHPGTWPVHPLG